MKSKLTVVPPREWKICACKLFLPTQDIYSGLAKQASFTNESLTIVPSQFVRSYELDQLNLEKTWRLVTPKYDPLFSKGNLVFPECKSLVLGSRENEKHFRSKDKIDILISEDPNQVILMLAEIKQCMRSL